MSIYTLNNLIKLFKDIADAHYQIKYFGFGELWEVDGVTAKKMENYPVLWVVPTGATQEENTTVFTFDVLCFDNVENDESNENEVLSDTIQILQDVVRIIRENSDDYEIDSFNNIYLPFTEKFNSRCTGWTASLGIRVDFDFTNCDIPASDFISEGTSCLPVYIYDINGDLVDTIESGGSYTCDTSGGNAIIDINGSEFGSVLSGASLDIPVLNSSLVPVGIVDPGVNVIVEDATSVLKDTAGSVLSTTSIPAGNTQDITAPDGSAVLKNSANTTISTTAVKSGETKNITVADDSVRNSDSSYVANDVIQGVQKVLPDITFTDTDGATSSKPSVKNFSATLIPALSGSQLNNADAGLTSAQRQLINRVNESRTGQTTSYRIGDDGDFEYGRNTNFTTLASNNPFGNTNRFTDQSGGQTYSDNIVVDWMTGLMWFRTPTTTADWNAAIDGALAATSGGYTDWFLPNFQQLFSIGSFGSTQLLNYAPFSLTITTTGATLWTSTTRAASTTEAYILSLNGAISNVAKTGTNRSYIYCRQFTYANGIFS